MKRVFIIITSLLLLLSSNIYAENNYKADWLQDHGLIKGSNSDLLLEQSLTRAEAAVMIVRLLGKENDLSVKIYKHGFWDIPKWADPYVGYLYQQGLISGMSKTEYGSDLKVNGQQYTVMLLRVLGYYEKNGDFEYNNALEFGKKVGFLDNIGLSNLKTNSFTRGQMAELTYKVLLSNQNNDIPLGVKLYNDYVLTESDLLSLGLKVDLNNINYRNEMRRFVMDISKYAKEQNPKFSVIPQNGIDLLLQTENTNSNIVNDYIKAIDGVGQEDVYYGYNDENEETPDKIIRLLESRCDSALSAGLKVMVIDYCSSKRKVDLSYEKSENKGYISFASDGNSLTTIPSYPKKPYNENSNDINSLKDAKNFLYIINPGDYSKKEDMLETLSETNYDIILIDLFFDSAVPLTKEDINSLKQKANGGKRLVLSYLSIGEAEDYRYYWNKTWESNKPEWLEAENPNWRGNFKVKYWYPEWQKVIVGEENSYLQLILDAGFDGVYLDIIDAFEYYSLKTRTAQEKN